MRKVTLSQASRPLAHYASELKDEIVVVTKGKRAVAALVPLKNVDRESLALGTHPEFMKLIKRARKATNNIKTLALMDVYGRVARLLLDLAVEKGGNLVVPERLTHQEIADRVGSSREMISRIMKDLATGGYIDVHGRTIIMTRRPPAHW